MQARSHPGCVFWRLRLGGGQHTLKVRVDVRLALEE